MVGRLPGLLASLALVAAACVGGGSVGGRQGSSVPSPASAEPSAPPAPSQSVDLSSLGFPTAGWKTDFSKHSVDLAEIFSGGPPKDGIPAVDHPKFESIAKAREWLSDPAQVISVSIGDQARAYPIAILVWHEIVNDTLGGRPITVTFCPLCNTALVFDRTVNGTVSDFGTTGNLRFSDLVMYDRQTESWWQQATGEAIVGSLTGTNLTFLPGQLVSLAEFAATYPKGDILSRDTGHERPYGQNPYVGYDQPDSQPFLFAGQSDPRLPPKERVVSVGQGSDPWAFPYSELAKTGVAETTIAGEPIVVFWVPGAASPLDARDIVGRDIGATGVFRPIAGGKQLTFRREAGQDGRIVDADSGSTWSVTGQATHGPFAGTQLEPVVHADHFWFAWAAFVPQTKIWTAP